MRGNVAAATVLALIGMGMLGTSARADSRKEVEKLIEKADEKSDDFKKLVAKELKDSIVEGTRIESGINKAVARLETAIDKLKKTFDRDEKLKKSRPEAEDVVRAAKEVDQALEDIKRSSPIWEDWQSLLKVTHALAEGYELK